MNTKAFIPLAVGLGVGGFALKLGYDAVKRAQASTSQKGEAVQVLRARTDIPMAAEIRETMLESVEAPKALTPRGALTDKSEVAGRVTMVVIPRGTGLVESMLAPRGTPPGLASRIKDGYRAVAVKIDESAGVAGWIKPGSRVDVVAVMSIRRAGKSETISKVVLQNVEVVAVGQSMGTGEEAGGASITKSVTLMVRPEAVPRLHLAAEKGKIRLAMRTQRDHKSRRTTAMTEKKLLGEDETPRGSGVASLLGRLFGKPTAKPAVEVKPVEVTPLDLGAQPWVVEVVTGSEVSEVAFASKDATGRDTGTVMDRSPRGSDTRGRPWGVRSGTSGGHGIRSVPSRVIDRSKKPGEYSASSWGARGDVVEETRRDVDVSSKNDEGREPEE